MPREERVKKRDEAIASIARGFVEALYSVSDQRKTGEVVVRVRFTEGGICSQSMQVVDDMSTWVQPK